MFDQVRIIGQSGGQGSGGIPFPSPQASFPRLHHMCTKNLFALSSNPYYLPRIVRGIADYCVGVEVEKEAFDAKYFDMGLDWTGGVTRWFPPVSLLLQNLSSFSKVTNASIFKTANCNSILTRSGPATRLFNFLSFRRRLPGCS